MQALIFTANNELTLLHCGAEFFPSLIRAIDSAMIDIHLETYIFSDDDTGNQVLAALKRAAARGVLVYVMTDWLGTGSSQVAHLQREFSGTAIKYRAFNPWFRRGVARSHRKICVVDRLVAFVGGLNINDDFRCDYDRDYRLPAARWDFAVRVTGPLVANIYREVEAQWLRHGTMKLRSRWELFRRQKRETGDASDGTALAALVVRDNLRNRRTIQRAYLHALGHAKKSALLANPYFAPGRKLRHALESAAERGIDVTLLLGVGQFRLQDAVAHSFYPKLLKSGVKIVEYRKTQLHGKVAVVDENWATVGSSNYDGLSLFVNQEANLVVKDADFANALRVKIEHGIADGVVVNPDDYAHIPWHRHLWYSLAFWFYQTMIRVVTWGKYT